MFPLYFSKRTPDQGMFQIELIDLNNIYFYAM
jgi:hypothetical protein